MLEPWNTGTMGFGELAGWVTGKIEMRKQKRKEELAFDPSIEDQLASFHPFSIHILVPPLHCSMCEATLSSLSRYPYFQ